MRQITENIHYLKNVSIFQFNQVYVTNELKATSIVNWLELGHNTGLKSGTKYEGTCFN